VGNDFFDGPALAPDQPLKPLEPFVVQIDVQQVAARVASRGLTADGWTLEAGTGQEFRAVPHQTL